MDSYVGGLVRLTVLAVLLLILLGFARVVIELKVEKRRKRRLATTRDIEALSPSDFEEYVALLLEKAGYRVRRTGGSGDHGVDLMAKRGGTTRVVQCKRYGDAIGPSTIRELIGAMTNAGIKNGLLVTTSDFTTGAEQEVRKAPYTIDLIDGRTLVDWARTYGLPGQVMDNAETEGRDRRTQLG